jgi:hypothetical protein
MTPTHGMPRDLWLWTIAVGEIADLSTAEKCRQPRPGSASRINAPSRNRQSALWSGRAALG